MVFTSPPYFDLEQYSTNALQSNVAYPTVDMWLDKFLIPSMLHAFNALKSGGHVVVVLNDPSKAAYPISERPVYVKKMLALVRTNIKFKDLVYEGVIVHAQVKKNNQLKSPQPMWVWRKN